MGKIIKSIYKGMLGSNKKFFLMKFVIMRNRKEDKQWDLLRKIQLIESK